MSLLLERIRKHAAATPQAPALSDHRQTLDYAALLETIDRVAGALSCRRAGLLLDNGIGWACTDLALQQLGAACVPMPGFFSDAQLAHLVRDAGLDLVVTDDPVRAGALLGEARTGTLDLGGQTLHLLRIDAPPAAALPAGTAKISYTSGTTGAPKGVCLSQELLDGMSATLAQAVGAGPADRTLGLLPLSLLLENLGGLNAPLHAGAHAQLPPLAHCGMNGSSGLDVHALFAALHAFRPTTVILVPQLLKALAATVAQGARLPGSLRFAAVGGAPLSPALLAQARALGIPAFEGYGLSEAGSVVCMNRPGADRPGSVGKPLPGVTVVIDENGEIAIEGRAFLGYLGGAPHAGTRWRTGDLGHFDTDGFLYLTGRCKTAWATAFGRNLAPEWVEGELSAHALIAQACVFGEARPFNVAVVVSRVGDAAALEAAIATVNARLPDYARITRWIVATAPFTVANGLAGSAGTPDRAAIGRHYATRIDHCYGDPSTHVVP